MGYRFFEHTADIGIAVRAASLPQLFAHAGEAICDCMVDRTTVQSMLAREIRVAHDSIEGLLQRFLSELVFRFATTAELYAQLEVHACTAHGVRATARGERFDPARHTLKTEIKAVTYHQLTIQETQGIFTARIILDV